MQKPITVAREEFVTAIVDAINGAELPAFVKLDVLNNCVRELSELAKAQYKRDLADYARKEEDQTE